VAAVDVSGGLTREVQVVLDQERLRSYGLTVSQVIEALRAANQDVAAGRVARPRARWWASPPGSSRVDEIRSLAAPLAGGGRIPLTEVAEVRDTTASSGSGPG
jgi:hydrophobic/amphiphilic exporter-1 (mainly G- bacteria), HAE1 family